MKFVRLFLLLLFATSGEQVFSQNVWTLDKCIEYARANSITVKEQQNKIEQFCMMPVHSWRRINWL